MAVTYGKGTHFFTSDSVTLKDTIADFISIIDPDDVPLLMYLGTKNQDKFQIQNWGNHTYAWFEDQLRPRTATLGEALDTTETAIDVAAGHGVRFHVGDVWRMDETGELILVTAHDGSDTITTVIRNWDGAMGGTQGTATTGVSNGTGMTYLFTARREGADSTDSVWTVPDIITNHTQIMHHSIKITNSEMEAARYGIPDRYKRELMKALGGAGGGGGRKGKAGFLLTDLENTFFYGRKVQRTGATVEGAMGGFKEFVSSAPTHSVNAGGADLTLDMVEDLVQNCWNAGSRPTTLVCNYFQKRALSAMFSGMVQTERSERTGGVIIDRLELEGATLDILLDRRCPPDELYIFDRDELGWVTLRDWEIHKLAVDGDLYCNHEIVGEFGFVMRHATAHGYIRNLATS